MSYKLFSREVTVRFLASVLGKLISLGSKYQDARSLDTHIYSLSEGSRVNVNCFLAVSFGYLLAKVSVNDETDDAWDDVIKVPRHVQDEINTLINCLPEWVSSYLFYPTPLIVPLTS